jgi:AraC-like DNA-binding protein
LWSHHPGGSPQETKEHGLYFAGVQEAPTLLASCPRDTGFVVVEFRPHGAYPFLNLAMGEIANGLFSFDELRTRLGREMRETVCNLYGADRKIEFVQARLARLLADNGPQPSVVDYAVARLEAASGSLPVKGLERETGYSSRYLERLFKEQVGVGPKALGRIFRFQRFYTKWAQGQGYDGLTDELYDYYHDQSHFAKEFKEFTGYAPRRFASQIPNEFGRRITLG